MNNKLQLICIKTRDSVFISDNVENETYFTSRLENLIIEGETLEETYKKGWYKLKNIPEKIYKKIPAEKKNQRYELKQEESKLEEVDFELNIISEIDQVFNFEKGSVILYC